MGLRLFCNDQNMGGITETINNNNNNKKTPVQINNDDSCAVVLYITLARDMTCCSKQHVHYAYAYAYHY